MFDTAAELLNNIRLLGFNPTVHSKGQLTGDLDPNLFRNNGDNSKPFQVITFFLFRCLDKKRTEKEFEGCFPVTNRSQANTFLNKTCAWLEDLRKTSPLLRHVPIRRSYLIDCRGIEINEIMVAFSTVVLQKVLSRDKIATDAIYKNPYEIEQAIQRIHEDFQLLQADRSDFMQNASTTAKEYSEALNDMSFVSSSSSSASLSTSQQPAFPNTALLKSSLRKPLLDVKIRLSALQTHKRKHYDNDNGKNYSADSQQKHDFFVPHVSGVRDKTQTNKLATVSSVMPEPPFTKKRRFELKDMLPTDNTFIDDIKSDSNGIALPNKFQTSTDLPDHSLSQLSPELTTWDYKRTHQAGVGSATLNSNIEHLTSDNVPNAVTAYSRSSPMSTSSVKSRLSKQLNYIANTPTSVLEASSPRSAINKSSTRSESYILQNQQLTDYYNSNDDGRRDSRTSKSTSSPIHRMQTTPARLSKTPEAISFQSSPFSSRASLSSAKALSSFRPDTTLNGEITHTKTVSAEEWDFPNFRQQLTNLLTQLPSSSIKHFVILPTLEEIKRLAHSFNDEFDETNLSENEHIDWKPPPFQLQRHVHQTRRYSSSLRRLSTLTDRSARKMTKDEKPFAATTTTETAITDDDIPMAPSRPARRRSIINPDNGSQRISLFDENDMVGSPNTDNGDILDNLRPSRRFSDVSHQYNDDNDRNKGSSIFDTNRHHLPNSGSPINERSYSTAFGQPLRRRTRQSITSLINSMKHDESSSDLKEMKLTDNDQNINGPTSSLPRFLDSDIGVDKRVDGNKQPEDEQFTAKHRHSSSPVRYGSNQATSVNSPIATHGDSNNTEDNETFPLLSPKRQRKSPSTTFTTRNNNGDLFQSSPIRENNSNSIMRSPLKEMASPAAAAISIPSSSSASPYASRRHRPGNSLVSLASPDYRNLAASASASPLGSVFIDDVETVAGIDGEEPPWRSISEEGNDVLPQQRQQRYPRSQYYYDIDLYTPSRPVHRRL
ncbi:HAUS augmin-like complex subunit 6 N-terminus-domain-containing protein [Mycotypha africana]|uniref:HAUS augmin-like complex subunit 6 N-terminus-domain-containing protein n=1 Tax=Mycotypha africana TaxID=64632 RepID=UPI0023014D6A|nr:HAUS augmin-like complex subunit 6 N-terminus-domain-containing protein [Mycotypha africana]KAI8979762.1 HAUS augmin-like complex subunit 6 N-terminus-domain-containing protein [Mycotypha africana]